MLLLGGVSSPDPTENAGTAPVIDTTMVGTYIFNLGNTWEKLQMAAQVIFSEPKILILTDPRTGHREGALGNIQIIAFRDTDSPMRFVDIGIHANNKGKQIIGCLFLLLARMVLQMCGTIRLAHKWEVVVDLLLYREPEEAKPEDEDEVGQTLDYLLLNMVVETNGLLLRSLMLHGQEKPRRECLHPPGDATSDST
ncbi:hypothetical protein F2Q70_00043489 [Brassica cretica]|uniref:Uncharacterized protein n=1 Tax=Brassica cretica TaxID=69181 RepID=A0A8S9KHF6_BRACR|nr:hypothetical protein F2Q70_00043489 [Brassica cretica]